MIRAAAPAAERGAAEEGGILRIEFCAQANVEWSTVRFLALTRRRVVSDFGLVERSTVLRGHRNSKQLWNQWPNLHPYAHCPVIPARIPGPPSPFVYAPRSLAPAFGNQTLVSAVDISRARCNQASLAEPMRLASRTK